MLGMSQDAAAKALKVSRSALGYYERGERQPDAEFIIRAAQHYGVTSDYLLGLSRNKTSQNQAIAEKIPLSDDALDFLRDAASSEGELLLVDDFLASPDALTFFSTLYFYVVGAAVPADKIPPEVTLVDSTGREIKRQDGADYFQAMTAQNWEAVCTMLKKLTDGICLKWMQGGEGDGNGHKAGK
jgi:transcriptional regulator with XRE-family HTH domain